MTKKKDWLNNWLLCRTIWRSCGGNWQRIFWPKTGNQHWRTRTDCESTSTAMPSAIPCRLCSSARGSFTGAFSCFSITSRDEIWLLSGSCTDPSKKITYYLTKTIFFLPKKLFFGPNLSSFILQLFERNSNYLPSHLAVLDCCCNCKPIKTSCTEGSCQSYPAGIEIIKSLRQFQQEQTVAFCFVCFLVESVTNKT